MNISFVQRKQERKVNSFRKQSDLKFFQSQFTNVFPVVDYSVI